MAIRSFQLLRAARHGVRVQRNAKANRIIQRQPMKWKSPGRESLPEDKQEVLISVEGVYYVAVFDAVKTLFRVEEELKETVFRPEDQRIFWSECYHEYK